MFFFLFWNENLGINAMIYVLLACSVSVCLNIKRMKEPVVFLSLLLVILAVFNLLYANSSLSIILLFITFFSFFSYFHLSGLKSFYYALLCAAQNTFTSVLDFSSQFLKIKRAKAGVFAPSKKLKLLVIPLVITIFFCVIYSFSNPIIGNYLEEIFTSFFNFIERLFYDFSLGALGFFLFGTWFSIMLLFYDTKSSLVASDLTQPNRLHRARNKRKKFAILDLLQEFRIAILTLGLLNVLLLFVNAIDVQSVWINYEVISASQLSGEVHEGTYLLIFSILISIGIIVYYFRGNLNFYRKNAGLKLLAYLWLGQNMILACSTAIKCWYYVENYGLTYKRIGVLIFLIIVVSGLVLVVVKIGYKKTSYFLFRYTALVAVVLMSLSSSVNWDYQIVQYNLSQPLDQIDLDYALSFSEKSLPALKDFSCKYADDECSIIRSWNHLHLDDFSAHLKKRITVFKQNQAAYSWLSWNYADYHTKSQLLKHSK